MNQQTPASKPVVLYCFTRYQDCSEEAAKIFDSAEGALNYLHSLRPDPSAMDSYQLFELGREIPLESEKVRKEEVRIKETVKYKIKE